MEYADLDVQEPSALGAARRVGKYLHLSADVAVLARLTPGLREFNWRRMATRREIRDASGLSGCFFFS